MARYKINNTPFKESIQLLEKDNIKPIYFLMGEDQYLQQLFSKRLANILFNNEPIQKMMLIPDEIKSNDIIDHLTSTDLFSNKKLFLLRSPSALKGKSRDELLEYCRNPINGHFLIILQDEYGVRNKFLSSLVEIVNPISCSTPFDNEMIYWAKNFFQENDVNNVPLEILKSVIEISGDSLNHLKNEIDKIAILSESNNEIKKSDIKKFSGWKRKFRQFEFLNYLGQKKLKETIQIGRALVSQDISMINLIYPLTEFFQELLFIKISQGTNRVKKGYTRLSPSVNKKLPNYANRYTSKEIILALKRLAHIDRQLKTSRIKDESAITEFVYATLSNG